MLLLLSLYRKADGGQLMVTGWSDGAQCHTFLAHHKRVHYLKVCGVDIEDPGLLTRSIPMITYL